MQNPTVSTKVDKAHRNWKIARRRRRCQDFSTMLYWEQMTSCSAL